jgi:recombination protein RecR
VKIARPIQNLIDSFAKLPGIGPKTAQRLTFYLLHVPQTELNEFSESILKLKTDTKTCSLCFNISEQDPCRICSDSQREKDKICVVEQPLDILTIEKGSFYKGLYHVLHGVISPLDNIGPEHLHIHDLFPRLNGEVAELIIATNPTMEGEATAMYIAKQARQRKTNVSITRIGRGLPTGADIEYADEATLNKAFEGRVNF